MKRQFIQVALLMAMFVVGSCADDVVDSSVVTDDAVNSLEFSNEVTLEEAQSDLESLLDDFNRGLSKAGVFKRVIREAYTIQPQSGLSKSSCDIPIPLHIISE